VRRLHRAFGRRDQLVFGHPGDDPRIAAKRGVIVLPWRMRGCSVRAYLCPRRGGESTMIVRSARVAPSQHADLEPEWCGPPAAALRCPYLRVASESAHPQRQRQPFLNAVVVVGCSTAGGRTIRRPTRSSRSLSAGCAPRSIRRLLDHNGGSLPDEAVATVQPGAGNRRRHRDLRPGGEPCKPGDRVMAILQYGGLACS
jgi:hypothetical protein